MVYNTFYLYGEMAEWSNAAVSKTVNRATYSGVQIPLSPPKISINYLLFLETNCKCYIPTNHQSIFLIYKFLVYDIEYID